MAIESTEHSLATRFTTVATKFTWHPVTPFTPTPDLFLSSQATVQLKSLVTKVVGEYLCNLCVNKLKRISFLTEKREVA